MTEDEEMQYIYKNYMAEDEEHVEGSPSQDINPEADRRQ